MKISIDYVINGYGEAQPILEQAEIDRLMNSENPKDEAKKIAKEFAWEEGPQEREIDRCDWLLIPENEEDDNLLRQLGLY